VECDAEIMKNKIILDLCGGTGSWSKPYKDAGYDVRVVTMPEQDVRTFKLPDEPIYGILAAPPCTHFSVSGAQYWKEKDADGRTFEDVTILTACLHIIAMAKPNFWVIENPVGRMRKLLGDPDFIFNPCDFGDPWTKKTYLWGNFNEPTKNPISPSGQWTGRANENGIVDHLDKFPAYNWIMKLSPSNKDRQALRSVTPPGFSKAFYEANK